MNIFKIVVLILSGLALLYASSMRLINPTEAIFLQTYFENSANSLAIDIDLVNEIRGVGAVMFLGGLLAFLGTIRADVRQTSFAVTTLIFGGVVFGRSLSLFMDGIPNENLIRAASVEIVLGILSIFCLINILIQSRSCRPASSDLNPLCA
ncbi:MAG: DUF4345 domain-containing protein [Chloroflexota bacterium]